MYLLAYQLKKEPFHAAPDPAFFWPGPGYQAALDSLRRGILEQEGCLVLTGDNGLGKTVVINRLAAASNITIVDIPIHDPDISGLEFFNLLSFGFEMRQRFHEREEFMSRFAAFLQDTYPGRSRVLLVLNEAHRFNRALLAEALGLCRLEVAGRRPLKPCLVGLPALERMLPSETNAETAALIAARCRLEPLTPGETRRYIEHRLKVAGRDTPLFNDDAVRVIQALSHGNPRLINMICDHALLCGYSLNQDLIEGRLVTECSRDLAMALDLDIPLPKDPPLPGSSPTVAAEVVEPEPPPRGWRPLIYIAGAVAAAILGLSLFLR